MVKVRSPEDLENLRKESIAKRRRDKPVIAVCVSTGCSALGAGKVVEALREEVKRHELEGEVEIKETGCMGFCELGPRLIIYPYE
ncbi:TPA: (2Fe-2S) ferredoxin domain-containing protein, partial [Candidatus Bathyarchaeota archaeon]|nr:(2Fe-2S) ferredoxin domain-containing protein [Candidatus Bathyarchaeota archaeon]